MPTLQATRNLKRIRDASQPIIVLEGSSRSGKTIAICQALILECMERPGTVVRAFRADGTTCGKTIVPDFLWVMREHFALFDDNRWNKQDKRYEFANGSQFYFDGCQDESKLHGLRQDITWLNEAMEIRLSSWTQIEMRTTRKVMMDFNPSINDHWVFSQILTRGDAQVCYIHSTYRDNPFLTSQQIGAIEGLEPTPENRGRGTANEWKWRVYGLGERAGREGRIFKNYRIGGEWPEPHLCYKHGYGMDFGFSADPSALIECAIYNDELHVRQLVYERGLTVTRHVSRPMDPSLELRLEQCEVQKHSKIYADCARPDNIRSLQIAGWNVIPCSKGKDSIQNGISMMQGMCIVAHRGSSDIIAELESYTWETHRASGKQIDVPIDENNHAIDAIRYWLMAEMKVQRVDISDMPRHAAGDYDPFG
jgi:phage terminase large subunit